MYVDTARGLESLATADDSATNCPRCDAPIQGITTTGPGKHFASPCGCKVSTHCPSNLDSSEERVMADGGSLQIETHLGGLDWLQPGDVTVGFGTLLVRQRETDAIDDVRERAARVGKLLTEAGFNVGELAVVTPGDGVEMFVGGRSG